MLMHEKTYMVKKWMIPIKDLTIENKLPDFFQINHFFSQSICKLLQPESLRKTSIVKRLKARKKEIKHKSSGKSGRFFCE